MHGTECKSGGSIFICQYYWCHFFMHYFSQIFKINFYHRIIQSKCHFQTISDQCKWLILWNWESLLFRTQWTRNLKANICLANKRLHSTEVDGYDFRATGLEVSDQGNHIKQCYTMLVESHSVCSWLLEESSQTHLGWG